MALAPTTHTQLRAAITSAILGVSPTDPYEKGAARWSEIEDPNHVATSGIRHFCIASMGSSADVEGGLIGDSAIETTTDITILTSYGAMQQLEVGDVVDADRADLLAMLRLAAATETILGLKGVGDSDSALTNPEEDGRALVEHTIEIRYMKATRR